MGTFIKRILERIHDAGVDDLRQSCFHGIEVLAETIDL